MLPGVRSGALVPFPCALGVVGLAIPVRLGGCGVRYGAFVKFPSAMGFVTLTLLWVVGFFLLLSAHSRAPLGSKGASVHSRWGRRVRAVFDASAKSSSGVSLNDLLLVGPTVHSPLIDVLALFRPILVRPGGHRVRRSIPVRPRNRWVRLGAFTPFTYALGVVRVCSVHSRVP